MDKELSKSIKIGTTFTATYIASYYMRNLLSVFSPAMLETNNYTKAFLGTLSSVYMIAYAIGQLVNGLAGDKFSPKLMITVGLIVSGLSSIAFPFFGASFLGILCFAILGFGLSMLRGPMMKVISENTKSNHARVICAFFSSAGFIGAFIAGLFAMMKHYESAFIAAGVVVLLIAAAAFLVITHLEQKKLIHISKAEIKNIKDAFGVFSAESFIFYLIIGMLVEIAGTSISFWIPTYLTENLGFDKNTANMLFVIKSIIRASAPFISVWLFNAMRDDIKIVRDSFLISAVFFAGMVFVKNVWANVVFFTIALLISGFASAMLWSVYIPSLKKTGKVSSANGILDCTGYIGAAVANFIFAQLMDRITWNGVVWLWAALMMAGYIIAVAKQIMDKKAQ